MDEFLENLRADFVSPVNEVELVKLVRKKYSTESVFGWLRLTIEGGRIGQGGDGLGELKMVLPE